MLSILAQVAPAVAAIFVLPSLARTLGVERLGFLSLVWIIIGYFSFLDLGFSLAVTKSVASVLSTKGERRIPGIFWTAWMTQGCMGSAGGLILWTCAPFLANHVLRVPETLAGETRRALIMCAAAMPIIVMTPTLTGVLQAARRFDLTVLIQTPFAVGQYVLPCVCARCGLDLASIIGVLLLSRIASFLLLCRATAIVFPFLVRRPSFSRTEFRSLIGFGGWVTAGTLLAPFLLYADRFIITRVLSLSNVAYYSVPADALIRLLIVPASIMTVVFPAFSKLGGSLDRGAIQDLAHKSIKFVFYAMVVPLGAIALCASDLMTLWMGAQFAAKSSDVLRILILGALANSVARVPFVLLQGIGRPDLPSKLQFFGTPFQIIVSYLLVVQFGLLGAAMAWSLRLVVETLFLLYMAQRSRALSLGRIRSDRVLANGGLILLAATILAVVMSYGPVFHGRLLLDVIWALGSITFIYRRGLTPADRSSVSRVLLRAS